MSVGVGHLAEIALGHVTRERPHMLDVVLSRLPAGTLTPSALHPVFHGSFDWHSCVHGYWLLATVLRSHPSLDQAPRIRTLFDSRLTPERLGAERAQLLQPEWSTFERPYGWAWLLMLDAELNRHDDDAGWAAAIAPLSALIAGRWQAHLSRSPYPVRHGAHANTAFALALSAEYAELHADAALLAALRSAAWRWYGGDRACQAWEPGGDEFLSPTLIEAEAMRRLLPPDRFASWFDGFLPDLARGRPKCLFVPAEVTDRSDGKIVHLDGLNLSRAWCLDSLAASPGQTPARAAAMHASARLHREAALPHIEGGLHGRALVGDLCPACSQAGSDAIVKDRRSSVAAGAALPEHGGAATSSRDPGG